MNTVAATRLARRLALPLAIGCLGLVWWHWGLLRVPAGMDTMPDTGPPGSVCVIDKHPGRLQPGAVVFVDLPDGGTVLSRVVEVDVDGAVSIRHDNRESSLRWVEDRGPFPAAAIRGLVLTVLAADAGGAPRER